MIQQCVNWIATVIFSLLQMLDSTAGYNWIISVELFTNTGWLHCAGSDACGLNIGLPGSLQCSVDNTDNTEGGAVAPGDNQRIP